MQMAPTYLQLVTSISYVRHLAYMTDHSETTRLLSQITDAGLFERFTTAVLRQAVHVYSHLEIFLDLYYTNLYLENPFKERPWTKASGINWLPG